MRKAPVLRAGGSWLIMLPWILVNLFPLLVMVSTSFKSPGEVYEQPPTFIPREPTAQNYVEIWQVASLADYFRNSLIIAAGTMIVALLFAVPAAYALARFRFWARRPYMLFLLIMQMFPEIVLVLSLFRVVSALGLVNNLGPLILLDAVFILSFQVWMLTSYFESVPAEIEESAMVDGNSRIGAMLRMTLPLAWPGLVAVGAFGFIAGWNEFLFALVFIRDSANFPLTLGLFRYVARFKVDWHYLMASSLLATVVVMVLFAFVQRHLTRGLIAGYER